MDNLQTKQIHPSTTIELTEEQKKQLINELNTAPVVYEWTVNVPPFNIVNIAAFFNGLVFCLVGTILLLTGHPLWSFILCLILGLALGFFTRYLWVANKIYHYQLTPIGVRYTTQDNIPDLAFIIVRVIAWFGIAICLFAVVFVGPLALIGAGGMALLSFSLTKFSNKIDYEFFYFVDNYQINILRKNNVFSMKSSPLKIEQFGYIHCNKNQLDYILDKFIPYIKNYKVKEVTNYRVL